MTGAMHNVVNIHLKKNICWDMYSCQINPYLKINRNPSFPNFLFCQNAECYIILKQKINSTLQLVSNFPQMISELSYLKSAV
jgi:hypothetical protein